MVVFEWLKSRWERFVAWFQKEEVELFEDIVRDFSSVSTRLEKLAEAKRQESSAKTAEASRLSTEASIAWSEAQRASGVAAKVRILLEG